MNVDDFLESLKSEQLSRKGKLLPWKDDILKLRSKGVAYAQIVRFLELNNVKASLPGIQQFCRKHSTDETLTPAKAKPVTTITTKEQPATPAVKKHEQSDLPPWHMGKAKSLDDLI